MGAPAPRAVLGSHRYGKSRVRVMRVTRHADRHDLDEWSVEVLLRGDFAATYLDGDNTGTLATDTMKNMVYACANTSQATSIEAFACELIDFLLGRNPQVAAAEVTIESVLWKRLTFSDGPCSTSFMRGSAERQTAHVARAQQGAWSVTAGLRDLNILKTADSAFAGFLRDEYTTLAETDDRLFGTSLEASWPYTAAAIAAGVDWNKVRHHLREAMLLCFARHASKSVQQTMFAMGEAALAHTQIIDEVSLRMPNKHNLLVDLSRFGQTNANHIFVPTDEPHGTIEATVRRAAATVPRA